MLIIANQAFECVNRSTGEKFTCRNKDIVTIPEWVEHDRYFNLLCADGKITCHVTNNSVDVQLAKDEAAPKKKK